MYSTLEWQGLGEAQTLKCKRVVLSFAPFPTRGEKVLRTR